LTISLIVSGSLLALRFISERYQREKAPAARISNRR